MKDWLRRVRKDLVALLRSSVGIEKPMNREGSDPLSTYFHEQNERQKRKATRRNESRSAIRFISHAWPRLPPHVKETILTTIDASLLDVEGRPRP